MSHFTCSFHSKALLIPTTVQVVLPYPAFDPHDTRPFEELYRVGIKFKTLYLFHGAFSDANMWLHHFNIAYYAGKYHLAIVMPSVGNSFNADLQHGPAYWTYVSEELPRYLRSIFPLSAKREDNFVGGISMGGYGALKLALNKPGEYGAAICLSGALDVVSIMRNPIHPVFDVSEYFGGFEKLVGSSNDLYALLPKLVQERVFLPKLYMACGMEDDLYGMTLKFRDLARMHAVDLSYEEGPGAHTWEFWDVYLRRALDWLDCNFLHEEG